MCGTGRGRYKILEQSKLLSQGPLSINRSYNLHSHSSFLLPLSSVLLRPFTLGPSARRTLSPRPLGPVISEPAKLLNLLLL